MSAGTEVAQHWKIAGCWCQQCRSTKAGRRYLQLAELLPDAVTGLADDARLNVQGGQKLLQSEFACNQAWPR